MYFRLFALFPKQGINSWFIKNDGLKLLQEIKVLEE